MKVLMPCGLNEAKLKPQLILNSSALGFSSLRSIISIPPGLSGAKLWSPGNLRPFGKSGRKNETKRSRSLPELGRYCTQMANSTLAKVGGIEPRIQEKGGVDS